MIEKHEKIKKLKRDKNAVILAHYYVVDEIQEIADYVGDSFYLSEIATRLKEDTILLCGVSFMCESAKILSPNKKILSADMDAQCPMAHMASVEEIKEMKEKYEDLAVVCYVNSTAELKAHSDVCVTSSNALKIVGSLPEKNIYFIPDKNLGRYIESKLPEKNFIFNDGFCHVHDSINSDDLIHAKEKWPNAIVLSHPECKQEVLALSDYIGSTSGIIEYATKSKNEQFIVCTEIGVFYELAKKNPQKKFYIASEKQVCPDMKKITIDKIISTLEKLEGIEMDARLTESANVPLKRMLELSI